MDLREKNKDFTPKLLHEELIPEHRADFVAKVRDISRNLLIHPEWLMQVMYFETGHTFSPSIKNAAGSGAVGLIQFMPATAKGLGTTTEALSKMTRVQQLDWVYKYFKPYAGRMKSFADVYLAVFYPAAIGKPDNWVLPDRAYRQNAGLDLNKDGKITKKEIVSRAAIGLIEYTGK